MALTAKAIDQVRDIKEVRVVTDDWVRVNFTVPAEVRKRWRMAALERNETLTDMIIRAVNDELSRASSK
jgi:hypothetical protein